MPEGSMIGKVCFVEIITEKSVARPALACRLEDDVKCP